MQYLLVVCALLVTDVRAECRLSLKQDFSEPPPVFIRSGALLEPDSNGDVVLKRAEILQVACPGHNKFVVLNNHTTQYDTISLKCVSSTRFVAPKTSWVGTLEQVTCSAPPWYQAVPASTHCHGRNKMYRVGYTVSDTLYSLYELCFDPARLTTVYSKHLLTPTSFYGQVTRRPSFIEGNLFGKLSMARLYRVEHQRSRLRELLGEGMEDEYIDSIQYLTRGHLAAKADFSLSAEQRGTFHYGNAAPQWRRGNAGDWAALEEAVRRRVKQRNSTASVYTGTHGVCTLQDRAGVHRELYLAEDENGNGLVPVPLYYYKVVHDERHHAATAFVSINCPYYSAADIERLSLSVCDDVCGGGGGGEGEGRFRWLRWRNDGTHSFCCEYRQFANTINVIPNLTVDGLFY